AAVPTTMDQTVRCMCSPAWCKGETTRFRPRAGAEHARPARPGRWPASLASVAVAAATNAREIDVLGAGPAFANGWRDGDLHSRRYLYRSLRSRRRRRHRRPGAVLRRGPALPQLSHGG